MGRHILERPVEELNPDSIRESIESDNPLDCACKHASYRAGPLCCEICLTQFQLEPNICLVVVAPAQIGGEPICSTTVGLIQSNAKTRTPEAQLPFPLEREPSLVAPCWVVEKSDVESSISPSKPRGETVDCDVDSRSHGRIAGHDRSLDVCAVRPIVTLEDLGSITPAQTPRELRKESRMMERAVGVHHQSADGGRVQSNRKKASHHSSHA